MLSDDPSLGNFPFSCSLTGKKVVLYGGGTFGQQLMKRFVKDHNCEIVGWIDDDYWEYRRCCLNVDSVESITTLDYDYIVVASLNPCYIAMSIKRLLDYGVSEKTIISVSTTKEQRAKALACYLRK